MPKRVLVLGAGLVARPMIRFILEKTDFELTVATRTVSKAESMIAGHQRGTPLALDVSDDASLERLVSDCDLAVSLVPYAYHPKVAALCIKHRKDMVTTSYVKDEMRALDGDARAAGILILNEAGLDPGIDHMSAMKVIDGVRSRGGTITSFQSMTGALPHPAGRANPFGYKFSWSPRGVLLASRNPARFLRDGETVEVPGEDLFTSWRFYHVEGAGWFEDYPNRDSLPYQDLYNLPDVTTMYRGTLRNAGWCETMLCVSHLGLLDDSAQSAVGEATYRACTAALSGLPDCPDVPRAVASKLGVPITSAALGRLAWLGLFDDRPMPVGLSSPLDVLASLMFDRLALHDDETDMVVMQHEFIASLPGDETERIFSTLVDFGEPGSDTSVARTVSLPAAMAVKLVLDGRIDVKGVHIPVLPEIYNPILDELEGESIAMKERVEKL